MVKVEPLHLELIDDRPHFDRYRRFNQKLAEFVEMEVDQMMDRNII